MKYKVAFVCVGNSCRSQMVEGFAREIIDGKVKELIEKITIKVVLK